MLHSRMELFSCEIKHERGETNKKKGANYHDFQKKGTKNNDIIVVVKNNPARRIIPKEATCQEAPSRMLTVTDVRLKRKGIRTGKPSTTVSEAEPFALNERADKKVSAVPKPILPRETANRSKPIDVLDQMSDPKKTEKSKIERRFKTKIKRA